MDESTLLDPKIDIVFKMQFVEKKDLLIDLINAIRYLEPPVVDLLVLNGEITPDDLGSKLIRLDIVAQDEAGQIFDLEMQTNHHPGWSTRSVYYLNRLLSKQLDEGKSYRHVHPVIGVHLLGFDLFQDQGQAIWAFALRDERQPGVVLDRSMQINVLELPKADRLCSSLPPVLAQWITYFRHWREENVMQQIQHPPIQKAYRHLRELSEDKKARYCALAREMAERDQAFFEEEAEIRGEVRGESKFLRRLLMSKFGDLPAFIEHQLKTADASQLERWGDHLLSAKSLEQVFSQH